MTTPYALDALLAMPDREASQTEIDLAQALDRAVKARPGAAFVEIRRYPPTRPGEAASWAVLTRIAGLYGGALLTGGAFDLPTALTRSARQIREGRN